jgi:hypothetical protein
MVVISFVVCTCIVSHGNAFVKRFGKNNYLFFLSFFFDKIAGDYIIARIRRAHTRPRACEKDCP